MLKLRILGGGFSEVQFCKVDCRVIQMNNKHERQFIVNKYINKKNTLSLTFLYSVIVFMF